MTGYEDFAATSEAICGSTRDPAAVFAGIGLLADWVDGFGYDSSNT